MNDWTKDAACHKSYDHRFFGGKKDQQEAKVEYCTNCPVKTDCTLLRIGNNEAYGTWGGHIGKTNTKRNE